MILIKALYLFISSFDTICSQVLVVNTQVVFFLALNTQMVVETKEMGYSCMPQSEYVSWGEKKRKKKLILNVMVQYFSSI